VGYTLWRLVREDSLRVLIYSDATSKAEGFLTGMKNHLLGLESSSAFRDYFGAWEVDPKKGVWNQSAIVIAPRRHAHAEPSVDTAGIETSKVGAHYDLIIFDDLVSDKNVTTKELMEKTAECYKKALSLLKPGGEVLLVGTRWHFGDLYGRMLVERETDASFASFIQQAEREGTYPFASIGLTQEFLTNQRKSQGSYTFSCLYQNAPVDDETATFKAKDFAFYQPRQNDAWHAFVERLYITAVLDPIPPPSSDHGDDAALTIVGTDSDHNLYLLDAVSGRLDTDKQIDLILQKNRQWKFRAFGIETNAFQKILKVELERRISEARRERTWHPFSITEFVGITQGNKERRIMGLQPYHERGAIKLPGERLEVLHAPYSTLAYQMLQFPRAPHDDLLDSLAYHLQLLQPGEAVETTPSFPWGSAAWYEREVFRKREVQQRQRSPRRTRKPLTPLAFS
jgi:predicted phage terminase large subunit-like protein